jgi:phage terminase large subunit GpA-like protein
MGDNAFLTALGDVCAGFEALRPPNRVSVSKGISETLLIKRPGGASGYWNPQETPYMIEPVDRLSSRSHRAVCFVGPAQSGKCLDVNTPVLTTRGWSAMGDLRQGDQVFGPDGKPTTVLAAHEVRHGRPCFEVVFSDGETLVADDEHLWGVERFSWTAPNWRSEVVTTAQIAEDTIYGGSRPRYRYRVRTSAPLETPAVQLPLDPYLFGVWLGDGSSNQATISSHGDDAAHYVQAAQRANHEASISRDGPNTVFIHLDRRPLLTTHCQRGHEFSGVGRGADGGCSECRREGHHRRKHGVAQRPLFLFFGTFASRLRSIGVLGEKHIPDAYLNAGTAQRLALLQGLMDTDGSCDRTTRCAEFTSVKPRLVEGFVSLARSLGLTPKVAEKATTWTYKGERKHSTAFRVSFPVPPGFALFTLPRKVSRLTPPRKDTGFRQIVAVRPTSTRPVRCIQVDNASSLFLAGKGLIPTHNTVALVDGWLAHNVVNDPGDMLVVQMTQEKAREYSKQRVQRLVRNSPKVAALRGPGGKDATIHDMMFRHGMWLRIAWPTVTNLSSTSYRYAAITDYDRIPDDIDGEGDAFTLAGKRTTTYQSRGMLAVESSPGRDLTDPSWRPATPHEAPPVGGILGIYNQGDRCRRYWQCTHCMEFFEPAPGVGIFKLPADEQLIQDIRRVDIDQMARQYARIPCPHCGGLLQQEQRAELDRAGLWLPDGAVIDSHRRISGNPRSSDIASYWGGGAIASYVTWETLLRKHLQAMLTYALTGEELSLMSTTNTDQGAPYMPRHLTETQAAVTPAERKDGAFSRFVAPAWTRFLVATVDVQGGANARFVVQVHAVGPHMEQVPLDRYNITESLREGVGGAAPVDPTSTPEDWDVLTERVLRSTYRIEGSEQEVQVHLMVLDTGGEGKRKSQGGSGKHEGVTHNAYAYWRRLRREGLQRRVLLVKGAPQPGADWYVRETKVGGKAKEGDVPLALLNTNLLKDVVDAAAKREGGPGSMHFPAWLGAAWFDEFGAEVRNANGTWTQVRSRNEAFDLTAYVVAACMHLGVDKWRDWDRVPRWALPLDQGNSGILTRDERVALRDNERVVKVEPTPQRERRPLTRRATRSSLV